MEEIRFIENPTLYKIRNKSIKVRCKAYKDTQLHYINVGINKKGQYLSVGIINNGIAIKINKGDKYGYWVTASGCIHSGALVHEIAASFFENPPKEYTLSFRFDKIKDGIEYYILEK